MRLYVTESELVSEKGYERVSGNERGMNRDVGKEGCAMVGCHVICSRCLSGREGRMWPVSSLVVVSRRDVLPHQWRCLALPFPRTSVDFVAVNVNDRVPLFVVTKFFQSWRH